MGYQHMCQVDVDQVYVMKKVTFLEHYIFLKEGKKEMQCMSGFMWDRDVHKMVCICNIDLA